MAPSDSSALDVQEIREILPHRYPMLMVDRILEIEDDRIVGIKNVSVNEPHFAGHFPAMPVMPGVLIIETMAQVAGVLVSTRLIANSRGKIMFLASIDEAKFRRPVVPGDQLRVEMTLVRAKNTVVKMKGIATVDGKIVAEAVVMCKLFEKPASLPDPLASEPAKSAAIQELAPEPQLA